MSKNTWVLLINPHWEHSRTADHFLTINSQGRWMWPVVSGDSCQLPLIGAALSLSLASYWENIRGGVEGLVGLIHRCYKEHSLKARNWTTSRFSEVLPSPASVSWGWQCPQMCLLQDGVCCFERDRRVPTFVHWRQTGCINGIANVKWELDEI